MEDEMTASFIARSARSARGDRGRCDLARRRPLRRAAAGSKQAPGDSAASAIRVSDRSAHTLANGLSVRIVENHALPLVAVRVAIEAGSLLDPEGKDGLFTLDTLLMRDGTTSMTGRPVGAGDR